MKYSEIIIEAITENAKVIKPDDLPKDIDDLFMNFVDGTSPARHKIGAELKKRGYSVIVSGGRIELRKLEK